MLAYVKIFIITVGIIILLFDTTEELPDEMRETINTGGTFINVFKERGRNMRLKPSFNVDWPWAISIGDRDKFNDWVHACDGVLVTSRHVITSANCLKDYEYASGNNITTLSAKAGNDHVKFVTEGKSQELSVMDYKLHPEFDDNSYHYKDIAVLILSSDFQFTDFVVPAYLPTIEEAANSTKSKETDVSLAICGWSGTHASDRGRTLEADVITSLHDDYCLRIYKGEGLNGTLITDDVICAVNVLSLNGSCAGGKGSGIFQLNHVKERFVLTGILSSDTEYLSFGGYRKDCGSPNSPNVFVRIASKSIIGFLYNVIYNIEADSGISLPPPQEHIQDDNREEECGINNVLDKVLNMGRNMSEGMNGRWPWLVPLFKIENASSNYTVFCGATILSSTTLLTAAHCFNLVKEKYPMKVRAGWLQESSDNSLVQEVNISLSDIIIHPSYKRNRYFDLAIIHLQSPLHFTRRVSQVCLLSLEDAARLTQDDEVSLSLSVSGWGHNDYWLVGKSLKQNVASIFSKDICNKTHQDVSGRAQNLVPDGFTEDVLCAGDPAGQSGTCRGDSGGGAVHFDQTRQRYVLRAVVSGSKLGVCGTSYAPNIYVRMANHQIMSWIYRQLNCSIICDQRGSISGVCSAKGKCQCKDNVNGTNCDHCKNGTIHLSEMNPKGCSPCYCSGVTTNCTDGQLFWSTRKMYISDVNHGISLVVKNGSVIKQPEELTLLKQSDELSYRVAPGDSTMYYWALPQQFLGNKVTAYGGNMTITQRYETSDWGAAEPIEADIIIKGNGFTLLYNKVGWPSNATTPPQTSPVCPSSAAVTSSWTPPTPPAHYRYWSSGYSKVYRVPMSKDGWMVNSTGEPATREDFLKTIINIEAILIRATLDKNMGETLLKVVMMDIAVPEATEGPRAQGIEECQCPKGYNGSSCEECAKGFYKDKDRCLECPCNNNEQSCSVVNDEVQCVCKEGYTGNFCKDRAINCSLSNWSKWSRCSVSCGGGLQNRVRWIIQEALHGGAQCEGESRQEQKCAEDNCRNRTIPVDCSFSNWTRWSACSVSCGGGEQHRVRWINQEALHGGAQCRGESSQMQQCGQDNCPVDCSFSNWTGWSACSVSCGGGDQHRVRWIIQEALHGGAQCGGESIQMQQCGQDNCPVDCFFSNWNTWSPCTISCGGGVQSRERRIIQEALYGGVDCSGESSQEQQCAQDNCPSENEDYLEMEMNNGSESGSGNDNGSGSGLGGDNGSGSDSGDYNYGSDSEDDDYDFGSGVLPWMSHELGSVDLDEVILIAGGEESGYSVEVLDLNGTSVCTKPLKKLTSPRNVHTINILRGSIVLCGGWHRSTQTSCIQIDHTSGEWVEHSTTTSQRYDHSSAVAGGELHLLGGRAKVKTVESFKAGKWTKRGPAPYSIGEGSCSVQAGGDTIIVTGGDYFGKKVARWDVVKDEWDVNLKEMSVHRSYHGCGTVTIQGGKQYLVVAGGSNKGNVIASSEIFDIEANTQWVVMENLKQARMGGEMITVKGVNKVFMMGGKGGNEEKLNTIEELTIDFRDLGNSTWTPAEVTMNVKRVYFAAVAVPKMDFC